MKRYGKFLVAALVLALVAGLVPLTGAFAFTGPNRDLVALQGPVESMPNDGSVGQWMVGGVPVQVDEDTYMGGRLGTPELESWVKVIGTPDGNGGLNALRVKVVEPKAFNEIMGKITDVSDDALAIGHIPFQKSEETLFLGTPMADKVAHILYTELEDGSRVAQQVRMADFIPMPGHPVTPPANMPKFVHFTGAIESIPEGGLGTWVIAGREVNVTVTTWVDEHKGPAEVGARVRVFGLQQGDDPITAVRITVVRPVSQPAHDRPFTYMRGVIEAMPANGFMGDWVVDGRTVHVRRTTRMDTRFGQPQVGMMVDVVGYENRDGSIDAVMVRTVRHVGMPGHTPQPPHPTHTPQPPHPTCTPQPPHPTHTPQPPHPTHTPRPPHPTHTPRPPFHP
ncbi:MAG: hypothetical protein GXO55_02420 [Chloroflexi bacterium]|nr:hypothetical protein [Chloroflexota bacterium]